MPTHIARLNGICAAAACALFLFTHALSLVQAQTTEQAAQTATTQATATGNAVQVIPYPKQLKATGEAFRLVRGTRIVLADRRSEDDRFAAQDFIDDVRETAGVALEVGARRGRRQILVGSTEHPLILRALERAGLSVPQNLSDEGYVLGVAADEIVVAGKASAGVFYGMQTLKQLVRGEGEAAFIQGVKITDWPTMRWRAFSDDISRGPVPTVEYVKRQLRTFAAFKLNMHSFYMEHTFKSGAHPLVGPEGGSLAPEEIRELVSYARRYHIELVPEQQTFGHLHKALKLEKYSELGEVPYGDVLSPQAEGSYKLIADWYRELDQLFPGQFFHIGADEVFELSQGRSREEVKSRGTGAVYFQHLGRVREILKPYKRRLMFWGDIALNHPELLKDVPRDMIVMNWAYGAREDFTARIKPFKDAGLEQFVCPGVQSWNQIFPNTDAAVTNIRNFVRDGQAAGVLGMMNTQWDDDGESLFEMSWYPVVLGAAAAWQDAPLDVSAFERDFSWAFFRHDGDSLTKAVRALGGVNALLGITSSDAEFWRNPFTDSFQEERARALSEKTKQMRLAVEAAEETCVRERGRARRNLGAIDAMRFAARRYDHLGRRMQVAEQFSRDYWNAYLNLGDRRRVRRLRVYTGAVYNSLREMAEELSVLRAAYREQWLRENRPYWLDSISARYDFAIAQWLARGKELEEALRDYDETSTLPPPGEFGLGPRPVENTDAQ
ncbi:MAG TPA: glycoside hydrolase family 20 zincin-like fold domain-containing protein [Pyrinomonadaceae bacterium]|nr:glycoside hydrolase family 20 zincin-like fold domain-containing protein [Pyrinomonadaceae bacterium]